MEKNGDSPTGARKRPNRRDAGFAVVGIALVSAIGCAATPSAKAGTGALVEIASVAPGVRLDARYATRDSFLGVRMYPDGRLFAIPAVAERLARVQAALRADGLSLVVYDAYRPETVQRRMWARFPDPRYVADPAKGSNHSRACAVDVSLARADGTPLAMPTAYDDFTRRAHRDFMDLDADVLANRARLERAMVAEGFVPLPTEWWHFDAPECRGAPLLDLNPWGAPLFPEG